LGAQTPVATGLLPAREPGQVGVEGLGVVQHRVLDRDPQLLDLTLPPRPGHLTGVVEQPRLRQLLQHHTPEIHDPSQPETTDSRGPSRTLFPHRGQVFEKGLDEPSPRPVEGKPRRTRATVARATYRR